MSSEQVIACNGFGGGCQGMDCPVCDGVRFIQQLRNDGEDDAADLIEQLQARNAEQAAELARWKRNEELQMQRAIAAESKLTALLDGIEGLVKDMRERSRAEATEGKNKEWAEWVRERHMATAGTLWNCADKLDALRESSAPNPPTTPENANADQPD